MTDQDATQERRDEHSTEFGLWTREQPELKSSFGFVATNIDFIWGNYKGDGLWMLLEEKRFCHATLKHYQKDLYQLIHRLAVAGDPNYRGFHKLVFQNTSPDDGWICLDNGDNVPRRTPGHTTKDELIAFMRFEAPRTWYDTRCIHPMTKTTITPTGVFSIATISRIVPFGRVITKRT